MGAVAFGREKQPLPTCGSQGRIAPPPSPPASNFLLLFPLAEASKEPGSKRVLCLHPLGQALGLGGSGVGGCGSGGEMGNVQHTRSRRLLSTCFVSELVHWRPSRDITFYRARSPPSRQHRYALVRS